MSIEHKTLKLCSCNGTLPIDARALAAALKSGAPATVHTELCRKEVARLQGALGDAEVMVACTQEAPLFGELARAADSKAELRFVNIRETAGWSAEGKLATPKIAALLAAAALPEPDPVPNVEYRSAGELLIIGPSSAALAWAVVRRAPSASVIARNSATTPSTAQRRPRSTAFSEFRSIASMSSAIERLL